MMKKFLILPIILMMTFLTVLPNKDAVIHAEDGLVSSEQYYDFEYFYGTGGSRTDLSGMIFKPAYFMGDNKAYNGEIAKCSVGLAVTAYSWENISSVLSQLEFRFDEYEESASDRKGNWNRQHTAEDNDFVRYVIATKEFRHNGESYILYCIPVQGTTKSYDWNSDFHLGDTDDHEGFYAAHDEIMQDLYRKLSASSSRYDKNHTIIWTTGHSRGAAVSNIVAGELSLLYSPRTDIYFGDYVNPKNVYGYTFACPAVSKSYYVRSSNLENVFNLNNIDDLIPRLPLKDWEYRRYGITMTLPSLDRPNVDSRYNQVVDRSYLGSSEAADIIEDILNKAVMNSTAATTPTMQAVFDAAAYVIRGGDNPMELLECAGIILKESLKDKILSTIGFILDPFSVIQSVLRKIKVFSVDLADYVIETQFMTQSQFDEWKYDHLSEIEEIEDMFGYNIDTPNDLRVVYAMTVSDLELKFLGVDTDASDIERYMEYILDLLAYFNSVENGFKIMDIIGDGHMPAIYSIWVNSMHYGYKGWFRFSGSTAPDVAADDDVRWITVGRMCFTEAANIRNLVVGDDFEYIGEGAFNSAVNLNRVVLSPTLRYVGNQAFYGCVNMTGDDGAVILPECLEYLGRGSFRNCEKLTSLEIPVGRISDGYYDVYSAGERYYYTPFGGCTNLSYIKVTGTGDMPEIAYYSSTLDNQYYTFNGTSTPWGAAAKGTKPITVELAEGITGISDRAFYYCNRLKEVIIPSTVTKIGSSAFSKCGSLTTMTLPAGLEEIKDYTFIDCVSWDVTDFSVPDGVSAIGTAAFSHCEGLKGKLTVPASVESIGRSAFANCTGLTSLEIPVGRISDGYYSSTSAGESYYYTPFAGCTNLSYIKVTGTGDMPEIASYTSNIDSKYYTFNGTSTPWGAASKGTKQITVELAEGITGISDRAFYYCNRLKEVIIPATVTHLGQSSFTGCTRLEEAVIPSGVTEIPVGSFQFDSSLKRIYFPKTLQNVNTSAYYGCNALNCVIYEGTETEWEAISIQSYNEPLLNAVKYYEAELPYFTVQPEDRTARLHDLVNLRAEVFPGASGYSWEFSPDQGQNWENWPEGEGAEITFEALEQLDGYLFRCKAVHPNYGTGYSRRIVLTVTGHEWLEPVWTWADDYSYARATFVCANISEHTQTVEATVESEIVEPTYEESGHARYTASVVFEEQTYTDVKEADLPKKVLEAPALKAENTAGTGIELTWDAVLYADSYRLERKTGSGAYEVLTEFSGTSYTDRNVKAGTKYTYRIRSADTANGKTSGYGKTVSLTYNPFNDVKTSDSCFSSLMWAYNNSIVSGTSATTFSPDGECTRAQLAIMLYRLNGNPAVSGTAPFSDIGSYSSNVKKAIAWCYNQGIVGGYDDGTYRPGDSVTRAQMAVMLWRMAGKPNPASNTTPFTDLGSCGSQAKKAIAWAYGAGITKGTSATKFGPNDACLRKQLVIFLYRYNDIYHLIQ